MSHLSSEGEQNPFVNMDYEKQQSRGCLSRFSKKFWLILAAVLLVLAIGLGVGLGVGLTRGSGDDDNDGGSSTPSSTATPLPPATNGSYWQPTAGTTWQIVLLNPPDDLNLNVSVYDIDLFTNPTSTIDTLHANGKRVICYFSAGSYEPGRPDSGNFTASDKGKELDGWPGEYWLNTTSQNVRDIMTRRMELAKSKGCDGVDPDNIDAYDNENGLSLTTDDAVNYVAFLAETAHNLTLSVGLKNGGSIVEQVVGQMEWEVNEQCVQYQECDTFAPFIAANKPVFGIEYPSGAPNIAASAKTSACGDGSTTKEFSTLLKELDLNDWMEACPEVL